jgi:hypothetical protein
MPGPRRATRKGRNHFPGMRLCSAQGRPFSRQASRARGRRGWYILCPEVPKLLKALWPAVPARSALLPACGSVVLPTPWGPRPGMTRPPPSHSRRTARFCSGLAPARRVRPRATCTSRLDSVHLRTRTPRDRRARTFVTNRAIRDHLRAFPRQAAGALRTIRPAVPVHGPGVTSVSERGAQGEQAVLRLAGGRLFVLPRSSRRLCAVEDPSPSRTQA